MQEVVVSDNPKDLETAFRKEGVFNCLKHCQEISEGMSSSNKRIDPSPFKRFLLLLCKFSPKALLILPSFPQETITLPSVAIH